MIARQINRGYSFKGLLSYVLGKDENVAFYHSENMTSGDKRDFAIQMITIERNAERLKSDAGVSNRGQKISAGGVLHGLLSWAEDQTPANDHQQEATAYVIKRMGLSDHQYVIVGHSDTDKSHTHFVVNLTHPETGKRSELNYSYEQMRAFAREYEQEHGIYCHNRKDPEKGKGQEVKEMQEQIKAQKVSNKDFINQAFQDAKNGADFNETLKARGLQLAPANRGGGFVVIDDQGKISRLGRSLETEEKGAQKTKLINGKLEDIDRASLGNADNISQQIKEQIAQKQEPQTQEQEKPEVEKGGRKEDLSSDFAQNAKPSAKPEFKKTVEPTNEQDPIKIRAQDANIPLTDAQKAKMEDMQAHLEKIREAKRKEAMAQAFTASQLEKERKQAEEDAGYKKHLQEMRQAERIEREKARHNAGKASRTTPELKLKPEPTNSPPTPSKPKSFFQSLVAGESDLGAKVKLFFQRTADKIKEKQQAIVENHRANRQIEAQKQAEQQKAQEAQHREKQQQEAQKTAETTKQEAYGRSKYEEAMNRSPNITSFDKATGAEKELTREPISSRGASVSSDIEVEI